MSYSDKKKMLRGALFRLWNSDFQVCLAPGVPCPRTPIKAHSIQRAGTLEALATDGHVYVVPTTLESTAFTALEFRRVGVRNASVFTGLCADHDARLFRQIDQGAFDPSAKRQLELLGYRCVLRETHACLRVAAQTQAFYSKAVVLGLASRDEPDAAGTLATQRIINAYQMLLYKEAWDAAMTPSEQDLPVHDLVVIRDTGPCIAVSAVFSLDGTPAGDDVARVSLALFPCGNDTFAVFSYLPWEAEAARAELTEVLSSSGGTQRYFLSRLVLERCENVVFAARLVEGMSHQQRLTILSFFRATVFRNDAGLQDPLLNLFGEAA